MNRTYFPTDSSFRIALGLAVNRIAQRNSQLLMTEHDTEVVSNIVADTAKLNDIVVNYIGFGSLRDSDVQWITEYHNRNKLWHTEDQEQSWLGLWEYAKVWKETK